MKSKPAWLVTVLLVVGPVLSTVGQVGGPASAAGDGLSIYGGNPYYWQYHGRPVLLLGGSSTPSGGLNDEGMFLWPNLPAALDRLKAAGGNYTRCLVSGRLRGETALWPFAHTGDCYDLDQWDEEYWQLFETFLRETQARGIVTDIEIWATFDYYREPNEAYCLADPGRQYAVYFPAGGSVCLDLAGCQGETELQWLDVEAARWSGPTQRRSGPRTGLDAPGPGQRIAVLCLRRQP